MTEIIDLKNGYGRIEGVTSPYASLTFPLTKLGILRLYITGLISEDEAIEALLNLGYEMPAVKWVVAVANVTTEQWIEAAHGLGAV